jgi:hypothetical protein
MLLSALLLAGACTEKDYLNRLESGKTIAVVNDTEVSAKRFTDTYLDHLIKTGGNDTPQKRYEILNKLIRDLLLAGKAEEFGVLGEEHTSYVKRAQREALSEFYYQLTFLDTLSLPSDAQVRAAYYNTQVKVYPSMMYFKDKEDAEVYYQRLEQGENFTDLANEWYDLPQYDSLAGYMGEISYFGVDHDFAEAAFNLIPGAYSEPVRTRLGYYLIQVNNRVVNPIITEDGYNTRYEGMLQKTKDRLMNVKGDQFVREFMEGLDVRLNTDNIAQIYEHIQDLSDQMGAAVAGETIITQKKTVTRGDVNYLNERTDNQTVLASFELNGETLYFTAEDYLFWLPGLSLTEAKQRTMASVGRALRNEVFASLGEQMGLLESDYVQYKTTFADQTYRAWAVKRYLSEMPIEQMAEEEIEAAYYGMNFNQVKEARFSGWVIERNSMDEVREIKAKIERGADPSSFQGYTGYENEDVKGEYKLWSYMFKVPINTSTIVNTNDRFYLIFARNRNMERYELDEVRDKVVQKMSPYYNMLKEAEVLLENASIQVDTTAFVELMEHFNEPSLTGARR